MDNQSIQLITGGYVKLQYDAANIGTRAFAYLIDMTILGIMGSLLSLAIASTFSWTENYALLYIAYVLVYMLVLFFDMTLELLFSGQTIGKMILRIKVINKDCQPPTFLQSFYRWIMMPIDFFVGLFFIAKGNQRLGDILSGCYVVGCRSGRQDKVNIANEFAYLSPNYKVQYPESEKLTEEQALAIQKVLHDYVYKDSHKLIEKKVREKLKLTKTRETGRTFLQTIMNDYKYIEMSKQKSI